jgi:hypothetical protein
LPNAVLQFDKLPSGFLNLAVQLLRFDVLRHGALFQVAFGLSSGYPDGVTDKALLDVDLKIARLREKMAAGKATLDTGLELDALLQERQALIAQISKSKEKELTNRA